MYDRVEITDEEYQEMVKKDRERCAKEVHDYYQKLDPYGNITEKETEHHE